ncbi:hypothetical protein SDC9_171764 [bioreactor metagenome]|uniref:Uncharacterized protein n=1 Tax=bioreactor metagenome TaxID=1076179 RepID=A0A645GDY8_9ZZZZ
MTFHHVVNKCQSTPLTSKRTFADTSKIRVAVKTVALKDSHHTLILHLTVFHYRLKNDFTVSVEIL